MARAAATHWWYVRHMLGTAATYQVHWRVLYVYFTIILLNFAPCAVCSLLYKLARASAVSQQKSRASAREKESGVREREGGAGRGERDRDRDRETERERERERELWKRLEAPEQQESME
jgi:hypothetical protein